MKRTPRPLAALAMVALISVISAGCSNAPASTGIGSSGGNNTAAQAIVTPPEPSETGIGSSGGNTTATQNAPASTGTGRSGGNTTAATTPAGRSGGNSTATTREQAVQFAQCMRKNGVSKFPDPDASGQLTIDGIVNGSGLDTSSAAYKQAISACKDLQPPGFTGGTRSPEQQQAALKFAQCIRDNGVKDFPDPAPDEPLVDTNRIPSTSRNGGLSILNAAMQKCRGLAADAGVKGGQ